MTCKECVYAIPDNDMQTYECDRCGTDDLTEYEIHHVDGEDLCDDCFEEEERKDGEQDE